MSSDLTIGGTPDVRRAAASKRVAASPLARRLAREHNLDIEQMTGSGPAGRVIKRDILGVLENPQTPQQPAIAALPDAKLFFDPVEYELESLTPMMQSIAGRLTAATSQVPHYYVNMDCRIDAAEALRGKLNAALAAKELDEKITLNDFIIRAAALALMDVPAINVAFAGTDKMVFHHADISVAVALPGGGLITPIVKRADEKSLREIAAEVKDLAGRAAEMRLKPAEYEGGTFSVSNLGMFGVSEFTAVINPPQSAILAIGGAQNRLVPAENGGAPETHRIMTVTMSCDHRVINGAEAAQFLVALKGLLEQPLALLFA